MIINKKAHVCYELMNDVSSILYEYILGLPCAYACTYIQIRKNVHSEVINSYTLLGKQSPGLFYSVGYFTVREGRMRNS
jgi:hypothetical protein